MKVVLFCGGYGMRMRGGSSDAAPKPLQMVGPRPLIWHVMRYYAHFGHTEFILCLGYGAEHIKNYFLTYQESMSNDFVIRNGQVELLHTDISDWTITFVDTGVESAIGERLRRVRPHLGEDEYFLANYSDVLTDAPLDEMIEKFTASGAAASMMIVPPQSSFHCVDVGPSGEISGITPVSRLPLWENGGYFVLTQDVFDLLPPGGDLVEDACGALARQGRLFGYQHFGFWKPADTFKERAELDAAYQHGDRPWMVWERDAR
ncbi:glucose-1-phosphate cytidylyltransferase [Nocardia puris]|uniref:sugar phosphate nucleotidyltransferase n=1 Tax=Nocardia puris TaxID=208602 RepID=UPI001894B850|nr:sugar phosphate nucleotidyltransferase [Nocardia puris]MBF6209875.1 glucose-1-phosphate cytidylyltransferase [Nocardia puris]MBF6366447.1 glucose-1-phosphate cytidylyltransferase [Nocardia puris]MBF6458214.1 glucose-1-phosphate cytidylyltransferase [Nocardia puris]